MIKPIFTAIFMFSALFLFAQTEEQLNRMAVSTCSCLEKKDSATISNLDKFKVETGLCMFEVIKDQPDSKELMGLFSGPETGRQVGEKIGFRMAKLCPKVFEGLTASMSENETNELLDKRSSNTKALKTVSVKVKKVEMNQLLTIISVDENDREYKFTWLEPFDGDANFIANIPKMKSKKLKITYRSAEILEPNSAEYRPVKVITKIEDIED